MLKKYRIFNATQININENVLDAVQNGLGDLKIKLMVGIITCPCARFISPLYELPHSLISKDFSNLVYEYSFLLKDAVYSSICEFFDHSHIPIALINCVNGTQKSGHIFVLPIHLIVNHERIDERNNFVDWIFGIVEK